MRQTACPHKPLCQTHCTSNSAVRPTERLVYCTARPMAFGDSPANTHLSAKYLRCQAHSPIHLVDKRDIRINHQRCAALDHIVTTRVLFNTKEREEEHWAPNTGHRDQYSRHRRTGQKASPNMLQKHGTATVFGHGWDFGCQTNTTTIS